MMRTLSFCYLLIAVGLSTQSGEAQSSTLSGFVPTEMSAAVAQRPRIVLRDGSNLECDDISIFTLAFMQAIHLDLVKPLVPRQHVTDTSITVPRRTLFLLAGVTLPETTQIIDLADVKEISWGDQTAWNNRDLQNMAYQNNMSITSPARPTLSRGCEPDRVQPEKPFYPSDWPAWAKNQPPKDIPKYFRCSAEDKKDWDAYEQSMNAYETAREHAFPRPTPHSYNSDSVPFSSITPATTDKSKCVTVPNADNPLTGITWCAPQ